ncbi:hypothetical protein [Tengunoibacter tsumagoiensis]|uniref:Uncharacterized protein n=1 Tax=Tengunoibacter tsumagoiensis TaxID=2014871 RepID=A0A402A0H3_9CHLR|nr:hypothetical protein [Tengunoibacter tsumagoiensis]GCE12585.1 hypothetical protein KTT_24440 [Tengunoibacter tsumagoiensis]
MLSTSSVLGTYHGRHSLLPHTVFSAPILRCQLQGYQPLSWHNVCFFAAGNQLRL